MEFADTAYRRLEEMAHELGGPVEGRGRRHKAEHRPDLLRDWYGIGDVTEIAYEARRITVGEGEGIPAPR